MNQESKTKTELEEVRKKKREKENQLRQLENQLKKLNKQDIIKERKARTKRLIERGAILESFIDNADEYTNDEIKEMLKQVFQKAK